MTYIHAECASAQNRVTSQQFQLALQSGGILLILDGFDEVDFSYREDVSKQILQISKDYPAAPIVISSRPDDKFGSWQDFYVFSICPLEKEQVLELIDKIDYDKDLKKRFRLEVDRKLFRTHRSFLSSPLLSSIMLLTYEQFAEIPTKMHIFYEQAFTALFRRHDATKAQFIRKTYANFALDDFKMFFAAFCTFTYLEQKFAFRDEELDKYVTEALSFNRMSSRAAGNLVRDLHECICMLQKDGLYTTFVHRSFQEYFCATFLATYNGPLLGDLIDRCVERARDDQVLPMLFEMAREKLDRQWVRARIDDLLNGLPAQMEVGDVVHTYNRLVGWIGIEVSLTGGEMKVETPTGDLGDEYNLYHAITQLHKSHEKHEQFSRDSMFHLLVYDCVVDPIRNWLEATNKKRPTEAEVDKKLAVFNDVQKKIDSPRKIRWNFKVRMTNEIGGVLGLAEPMGRFVNRLREIKHNIDDQLGGQDSMVRLLVQQGRVGLRRRSRRKGRGETPAQV